MELKSYFLENWQQLISEAIIILAIIYTLYNTYKMVIPSKVSGQGHHNCNGCSGGCDLKNVIKLTPKNATL